MGLLEETYRLPMVPPKESSRARIREVLDALKGALKGVPALAGSSGSSGGRE